MREGPRLFHTTWYNDRGTMSMDLRNFFTLQPPSKRAKLSPTCETESNKSSSSSSSAEDSDNEQAGSLDTTTPGSETSSSSNAKQAIMFRRGWLKGRESWLNFVDGKGMFCELCIKYDKRPFNRQTWNTIPCTCYRLQSITKHKCSAAHSIKLGTEFTTTKKFLGTTLFM